MKLKLLLLITASLVAFAIVACAQSVVFPTPLPTATPAPTATPIVFPTPLPTATPFALPRPVSTATPPGVIFPTPLPTATPVVFPSPVPVSTPAPTATPVVFPTPLPTATPFALPSPVPTAPPAVVAFPTPLPTATPISLSRHPSSNRNETGFRDINAAKVQPLYGVGWGVGFQFQSGSHLCDGRVCLLSVQHVVGDAVGGSIVYDGSKEHGDRIAYGPRESDAVLDIAVIRAEPGRADGLTRFSLAPPGTVIEAGAPIRVVTFDFYSLRLKWVADQMVLSGIVSKVDADEGILMIDAPLIKGNSGGVVLNADMQVIGMVSSQLQLARSFFGNEKSVYSRNFAVHVKAIRGKLCDWGFLVGADCR